MVKIIEVGNVVGGGGSGGAPSGAAGGSLAGTYPNPTLANGSVGSLQITNASVINSDLANMVPNTIKGRITAGTGVPEDVTAAQLATILGTGSGGGTTNFLRADGTWAAPPAGGGGGAPTGAAGGSLAGTYPNPTIAPSAITNTELNLLAVTTTKINTAAVTNIKLANMAALTVKGSVGGGAPADLTVAELTFLLVSSSGGGVTNFLRADGTWVDPSSSVLADNAVTNAKLADMAASTVKGRITSTGDPMDLTATQLTTMVNPFTSALSGAVPASGGGTTSYLRADGTWAAPPGGGSSVFSDSAFMLQDNTDPSKQFALEVSSIPTATTRTLSLPTMTADDTLVTLAATQTLTNKIYTNAVFNGVFAFRALNDVTSVNDSSNAIEMFGSSSQPNRFAYYHQGGTAATPAQTGAGSTLAQIVARGYTGSAYAAANACAINMISEDAVTTSARGGRIDFNTTANGTTTTATVLRIQNDGSVSVKNGLAVGAGATMAVPASGYGVECKSGAIGYGVGVGTSVSQTGSQGGNVTCNFLCGQITMMAAAGTTTWGVFRVNNSLVSANDMVEVSAKNATQNYNVRAINISAGYFEVAFQSLGGTASAAPIITFMVWKGVIT